MSEPFVPYLVLQLLHLLMSFTNHVARSLISLFLSLIDTRHFSMESARQEYERLQQNEVEPAGIQESLS